VLSGEGSEEWLAAARIESGPVSRRVRRPLAAQWFLDERGSPWRFGFEEGAAYVLPSYVRDDDLFRDHAGAGQLWGHSETEAAPIRYVAELLGVDADSERAIRWLIALMAFCVIPWLQREPASSKARATRP
jgi:hypothetical protein